MKNWIPLLITLVIFGGAVMLVEHEKLHGASVIMCYFFAGIWWLGLMALFSGNRGGKNSSSPGKDETPE